MTIAYWPNWFEHCGYMRHTCLPNASSNHVICPNYYQSARVHAMCHSRPGQDTHRMLLEKEIQHSASYAETSRISLHKWKQPLTTPWFAQPLNMKLQFGTPTFRKTSKPLNKSNAEQYVTFFTTTQPEHQGALQTWSTNSSGKALRQEEETTDSLCCIGSKQNKWW